MANRSYRRKPSRKPSLPRLHEVLPVWTPAHSNIVNLAFQSLLLRFGITDISSYFRKLRIPIAISVVVCALAGAASHGLKGLILCGLLGAIAPAVLLWLGVLLLGAVIFLAIYVITWAVVLWVLWCFLSSLFTF